ncbi:MAG: creatininase family protein [Gemmatimonadaceae bacterium]|nr:creatininase family protein [Gemmatimonadaceae bacterium]
MNNKPYLLAESTWKQVRDTKYSVAILPWGATEAHNYHLPYATDNYESDAVAAAAAEKAWGRGARVIVLPAVPFGVNTSQRDIALCINMNPSTQAIVLRDIVESVELGGIDKLVILNGHGGNDFRQMIRELQPRTRVFLSTINWYSIVDPTQHFVDTGDHAGELETSVCMHIIPELVALITEAGNGKENTSRIQGFREKWAWAPRQWSKVTADTGIGNPAKASAAKGKKYLEVVTEKIAGFLCELASSDVNDLYESDGK